MLAALRTELLGYDLALEPTALTLSVLKSSFECLSRLNIDGNCVNIVWESYRQSLPQKNKQTKKQTQLTIIFIYN